MVGAAGLSRSIIRKVSGIGAGTTTGNDAPDLWRKRAIDAGIGSFEVEDFNSPEGIAAIAAVGADLGVVAGTYILKRPAFSVPRLGCINLHSGKVPDYRGAAPAFWELYNGETHVGITIHKVEERLDAGNIITSDQFQLDWMPGLDPVQFIEDYRARILRPNGVRLMADAVTAIVQGKCEGQAVVLNGTKAYRTPTFKDICELRRRVKERAERIDT